MSRVDADDDMSRVAFVRILRTTAMDCSDVLLRSQLKDTADAIDLGIKDLASHKTASELTRLVGLFARGTRLMTLVVAGDPDGRGGRMRAEERLAA